MENIIENWINSDKGILDILTSIDEQSLDEKAAAEKAFYQLGRYLNLPLQPADITEEDYDLAYDQKNNGIPKARIFIKCILLRK